MVCLFLNFGIVVYMVSKVVLDVYIKVMCKELVVEYIKLLLVYLGGVDMDFWEVFCFEYLMVKDVVEVIMVMLNIGFSVYIYELVI